jgi:hypothetical protein
LREYGYVIGQADPTHFDFNVSDPEHRPINYEYVELEVEEHLSDGSRRRVRVLGQVKRLISSHPFYDRRTTPGAAWKQRELGLTPDLLQVYATAKVLGYINEAGGRREIRRPRSPPMPGTPVYRASDELLGEFFTLPEQEIPLRVGHLLHRERVTIPISGRELHRHMAILAMTRYGKSYFAGRIMEELLKRGASILAIDVHGDYTEMVLDPEGRLHDFFHDKVTVYRPEAAELFKAPHVKPLRLSASSIGFRELCALARVEGILQRILLRRVLKEVREARGLYALDDVIERLEEEMEEARRAEEKERVGRVILRLEDLKEEGIFTYGDIDVKAFFRPRHLSDIYLSGLPDYVQDVLVGVILRRVFEAKYRRRPWARHPLFIFVEEAHRFAAPPDRGGRFSRAIIARIAAEGSKFGLFLTVISQRPRRIDPDILSNCGNLAVFRVINPQDQRTIQAASESFSEDLLDDLPALEQGEAVLVGPFVPIPVMIKAMERETRHGGRTPDVYGLLNEALMEAEDEKDEALY